MNKANLKSYLDSIKELMLDVLSNLAYSAA